MLKGSEIMPYNKVCGLFTSFANSRGTIPTIFELVRYAAWTIGAVTFKDYKDKVLYIAVKLP